MNKDVEKPTVIVIVGPTAVGKTRFSIDLAKLLNTEVISADSMQIYKYMDIGTAKVTPEEMDGIRHYMLDIVEPDEEFSVAQYKEMSAEYLDKIVLEKKTPIIVGGTGLYINSIVNNIEFSESQSDEAYRNELSKIAEEKGNEFLLKMLEDIDEESAKRLHPNDTKRVIRALEVYKITGRPISYHQTISRLVPSKYNFILIGLTMDRELLYERINKRVDLMLEQGLIEEVKELLHRGYTRGMQSMQGIGYKEIIDYLNGEYLLEEAIEVIKRESRRYAKRQFTWFRRNEAIEWIDVTNQPYEKIFIKAKEYIAQNMEIM